MSETIFSLSTGGLPSGVAIIRLSGSRSRFALETVSGRVPRPRQASFAEFKDAGGNIIDRGLSLFFPAPRSFTGEDCGEFHLHGSRAVAQRMLELLGEMPGLRQAEPGEFTRRAFENGKMDLTEVEGLSDLLAAETEMQRRSAIDQSGGNLRRLYEGWMQKLTHARAMIEAELDFADEEDIPGSVSDRIWPEIAALAREISHHVEAAHSGEVVRDGFRVALLGAPNAGKSTLLNRLSDREVAIVSEIAGTTRDALEVRLDLGGYLVLVSDTAGLRHSPDPIEAEGMRRSLRAGRAADLILYLYEDEAIMPPAELAELTAPILRVRTKIDVNIRPGEGDADHAISAVTGEGVATLIAAIRQAVAAATSRGTVYPTRIRHRQLLLDAVSRIDAALSARQAGPEIAAGELRAAAHALGRITGQVGVEALLGVIFSEFCVGK